MRREAVASVAAVVLVLQEQQLAVVAAVQWRSGICIHTVEARNSVVIGKLLVMFRNTILQLDYAMTIKQTGTSQNLTFLSKRVIPEFYYNCN